MMIDIAIKEVMRNLTYEAKSKYGLNRVDALILTPFTPDSDRITEYYMKLMDILSVYQIQITTRA